MISRIERGRTVYAIVMLDGALRREERNEKMRSHLKRGRTIHTIVSLDGTLSREAEKGNRVIVDGVHWRRMCRVPGKIGRNKNEAMEWRVKVGSQSGCYIVEVPARQKGLV